MDDRVRLYCGDCLTLMRDIPDGSVDEVVTDPPYNVGFDYRSIDDSRPDYEAWCGQWFAELERVCRGPILLSCGIVNLGMWYRIKTPKWIVCWWKPAAMGRSPVGFCNWEPMPLYGQLKRREGCDVIRASIKPNREMDGHPCPKPVSWGIGCVELVSDPGMIVLDPFMGIGTVGLACQKLGRRFIGIEIDSVYFSNSAERLNGTTREPLFGRLAAAATPLFDAIPAAPPLAAVEAEGDAGRA